MIMAVAAIVAKRISAAVKTSLNAGTMIIAIMAIADLPVKASPLMAIDPLIGIMANAGDLKATGAGMMAAKAAMAVPMAMTGKITAAIACRAQDGAFMRRKDRVPG